MANAGQAVGTDVFGGSTYSPSNQSNLLNTLQAAVAPQNANAQTQFNLTQDQISQINPNLNAAQAYNNAMAQNQTAGLNIQSQQQGIQGLGLQQQGQQAATQQGFEQQQYGIQQGQYPEQQAEAALAYQNAVQQTQGGQAISGTQNTVGGKQQVSTQAQQYGFQQEDIQRAQALSQLGQASEQSGYGYSQQQLQNSQANLALIAKQNGLSQSQVQTMLGYGNTQAAQGASQDLTQLLSNASNIASGQAQTTGAALSPIGFASGINAVPTGG